MTREEFVRDMRKRQRDDLSQMISDLRKSNITQRVKRTTIKDEVQNA